MLHTFLAENHVELAKRCREKVAARPIPSGRPSESAYGVPLLIEQMITTLRAEPCPGVEPGTPVSDIGSSAAHHGGELLRSGYTVEQVVHDYGDLCQAVTELAGEQNEPITVDEFHTFNRCLDNAIADAVTEFSRGRDRNTAEATALTTNERLGCLAQELRSQLNSAVLAFQAIRSGSVAIAGATGTLLEHNLRGLRDLIDCSLADVRLTAGMPLRRERIAIDELCAEVRIPFAIDAVRRGGTLSTTIESGLIIESDRQMISSALANLLQNAVKYTPAGGSIALTARAVADRIAIEVADGCGGLAAGTMGRMFRPFARDRVEPDERDGLGFGLSISRRAIEANGGKLEVHDVPGAGCVFTIELPRMHTST